MCSLLASFSSILMGQMKPAEQAPMVHQPMRPVKIGVVRHDHQQQGQQQIDQAALPEIGVDRDPSARRCGVEQSNLLFGGQIGPATQALSARTTARNRLICCPL